MLTYQPAKVLHIYANSTDQWGGRPLYSAIIQKCLQLGVAGATAFRSFEGYGAHHQLHTARLLSLSEDLPVRIEVIDAPAAIDRLLVAGGHAAPTLITVSDTQVGRYQGPANESARAGRTRAIAPAPSSIHPAAYWKANSGYTAINSPTTTAGREIADAVDAPEDPVGRPAASAVRDQVGRHGPFEGLLESDVHARQDEQPNDVGERVNPPEKRGREAVHHRDADQVADDEEPTAADAVAQGPDRECRRRLDGVPGGVQDWAR